MSHAAAALQVTDEQRRGLEEIASSPSRPYRDVVRAKALLDTCDGIANLEIARRREVSAVTVRAWHQRFSKQGLAGFGNIAPGRGRKPTYSNDDYISMLEMVFNSTSPNGDARWSVRTMAKACGMGKSTVAKIWKALDITPQRTDTFKLSNDPQFSKKLVDIVGLYLNPPEKAVVLCVNEKSSIQALDRTQPSLPLKPGRAGTMTHDYKRHGTSALFAALDTATGKVIAQTTKRHRNQEFLSFLRRIDHSVPKELGVHIVLDNYATHKHSNIKAWLDKHPRFHFHFTPTSSSWLNQVERFFGILTDKIIRNQTFHSAADLEEKIMDWITRHNTNPTPFTWVKVTWVKDAETILAKINRARTTLDTITDRIPN
ncbi:IS630 family transposase [Corynebacterium yudongzhengii]|nr:IS630 family transposase [Corynebacterium yudongzhengii]AWB82400.1 IS630 family transposase [Corynebacterium yudongzhengii]